MSKQDLERLVEAKITELVQQKGEHVALREKMDKLEEENKKLREIAAGLGKQVADLKEVVRRVKEAERSLGEGKVTKIPRVTRNVGLQVNTVPKPMPILAPPSRPTPSPSPSASEDDVVLLDDDEGDSHIIVPQNTLPSGRRSLPSEGSCGSSTPRVSGGAVASLSRSSFDIEIKPQIGSGQSKSSNFSRSRKSNLSTSSSGSLSNSSISITKTRDQGLEPITLTVNKVEAGGIMVQWRRNFATEFDASKVVSYLLEGSQGSSDWTKVGDHIKPLTLPMACTLNGFKTGSTYRFRIRVQTRVDVLYSNPATVDL